MLTVSPSKATTGSKHTADVPLLGWLAVLTLSRARIVSKVVFLILGAAGAGPGSLQSPPSTKFSSFCCVGLSGTGVVRRNILGEIRVAMVVENISFCASSTGVLCARLGLRITKN